ncbi:cupredoxin domain-containing protein [Streptomyces sp. NBC_01476]|uniref:cupredoxin domain-containing protein n=1 Tax=Streptomyces sp. NBC_01476 TaxID=2903881 RepID=UPI002E327215|nr:cupredoxin domain-containing protein [Streptomyces sp. NBC_01476]
MIDTRTLLPRRRLAGAVLAGALLAVTGCSDSGGGGGSSTTSAPATTGSASASASASGAGAATIVIKNFAFRPATLSVRPGTEVTVMNQDSTTHTVTATGAKAFDTGDIAAGKTATFTAPGKAGSYPYICSIHTFMKGTLTVA